MHVFISVARSWCLWSSKWVSVMIMMASWLRRWGSWVRLAL